jgi:hypothetical protein
MFFKRNIFCVLFVLSASVCARPDDNLHVLQEQVIQEEKAFLGQCEGAVQDLVQYASRAEDCDVLTKKIQFLLALLPDDRIVYIAGALYVAHVFTKAQDELFVCLEQIDQMHAYWSMQIHRADRSYFLSDSYKEQVRLKIHDLEIVQHTVATKLGSYVHVVQQLQAVQSVQDIYTLFHELQSSGLLKHSVYKETTYGHDVIEVIQLVTSDLLSLQDSIESITENMHIPTHFQRHKGEYIVGGIGLLVAVGLVYKYQNGLYSQMEQGTVAAQDFFEKRVQKPLYNIYKMIWLQETKDIPVPDFESIVLHPSHTQSTSTPVFASWTWKDFAGMPVPVLAAGVNDDELLNIARKSSEVQTFVGNINQLQDSIKEMVPVINETKDKASLILEFISLLPAAGIAYVGYKSLEVTYNALFLQPLAIKPFIKALQELHTVCIQNMHAKSAHNQADGYIWYHTGQLEKLLYALPQEKAEQYRHDIAFLRSMHYSYEQKLHIVSRMMTLYQQ